MFWNSHSKADLEIQCSIIEDIINKAKTWSNSNIDLMNSSSKDIPVELIMSTIKYIESTGSDSERFVRSGLISEIINNIFFNSLVDTLSLEESSTTYSELKDIFYPTGHDYQALNMVEARGMRGLLGLLEISESSNLSKAEIAIILQNTCRQWDQSQLITLLQEVILTMMSRHIQDITNYYKRHMIQVILVRLYTLITLNLQFYYLTHMLINVFLQRYQL